MTDSAIRFFDQTIPGVHPASQQRSKVLLGKFTEAGRHVLLHTRLKNLSVPALAKEANSSVGGFYSRFDSKESFFEFLRMQMLKEHIDLFEERLAPQLFRNSDHIAVSSAFVDFMLVVFSGPWRGVLREAYSDIPENPDRWEPMKLRGALWRSRITEIYAPMLPNNGDLQERISMAVQLLFSALNNELMNPNLAFGIDDPIFRKYLIHSFDTLVAGKLAANYPPNRQSR